MQPNATFGRLQAQLALVLAVVSALLLGGVAPALAGDRVAELAKTLSTSSSDKARLAAATSLARLNDKMALKPLVAALGDPNAPVRVVAATALGKLGHKAALPALTVAANDDMNADVRAQARLAAVAIAKRNKLATPFPADARVASATAGSAAASATRKNGGKAGFGNQPRVLEPQAEVYMLVKSSTDDSPGKADLKTRKQNAEIVRTALIAQCATNPSVTAVAADAARLGLGTRLVDVSVIRIEVAQHGNLIELEAQLRVAVSDEKGKMLSFLSGAAKVQVPKATFNARYLTSMRRDALEGAMHGIFAKLVQQLKAPAQS